MHVLSWRSLGAGGKRHSWRAVESLLAYTIQRLFRRVQGAPAHEPAHDPRSSHRLGGAPPAVPRLPGDYTTELPSRYAQASVSRPAGFPKFQHRGSAVRLVAGKIMQPWPSMRCNPLLVRKTQFAGFRFFRRWNLALGRGKRGSGEETALRRIKTWGVVIC